MGSEEGESVAVLDSVSDRVVETDMEDGRVGRWSEANFRDSQPRVQDRVEIDEILHLSLQHHASNPAPTHSAPL